MPMRLPTAEELGFGGSLDVSRGIATADASPLARGALALAKGVQDLGGGLTSIAEKQQREGDLLAKSRADAGFIKDYTDLVDEQKNNPDLPTFERKYQEIIGKHGAHFGDDEKRELWTNGQAGYLARGTEQVRGYTQRAAGDAYNTETDRMGDDAQGVLQKTQDPAARDAIIGNIRERYAQAARLGYMTDAQARAGEQQFGLRSMRTVLGQQPLEDQVSALEGPAPDRGGAVSRIVGYESNGSATAKNPLSTATGAGQFIEGTWLSMIGKYRPDLAADHSRAEILALRNDPALSREMVGHYYDENLDALRKQNLPATPGNGYLSHVLGPAGAAAVLKAAPGTPVSDVLDADAISANRSILAGKTVDTVRNWAARRMGEAGQVMDVSALPGDVRQTWLEHTRGQLAAQQRQEQRVSHEEAATLQARISDDIASIEATGKPNPLVRAEDIDRVMGPQAVRDWQAQRGRSQLVHNALDGIGSLPEGEIEQRLRTLEPQPGVNGFTEDMAAYGKARKRADALMQARRADPALAVDALPSVQGTRAAAQYDQTETGRQIQPQSAQAIVRSRLAAQNQLGIPEPMAVTKSEAAVIARQLRAIGDDDAAGLRRFVGQLQSTYGEYADEVLSSTIQHQNVNRDLAVAATDVLGKLSRGQVPNQQDRSRLERASGGQRMDDALAGRTTGVPQAQGGTPARAAPSPALRQPVDMNDVGQDFQNAGGPDQRAPGDEPGQFQGAPSGTLIRKLYDNRADPQMRAEFDATFGRGTAERAIAETARRMREAERPR